MSYSTIPSQVPGDPTPEDVSHSAGLHAQRAGLPNPSYAAALQCYHWGANVTAVAPGHKRPLHPWKQYHQARQSLAEFQALGWERALGFGIISGIGGWRAFDLDGCDRLQPVTHLLQQLALPEAYPWVVRSGSGNGWQIWLRCYDDLPPGVLPSRNDDAGVFWGWPADDSFDHLELRWQYCHTILPPSQHPSGPGYRWRLQPPSEPPAEVSIGHILAAFFAVAPITRRAAERQAPAQEQPARHAPQPLDEADPREQIRRQFDLVAFARQHFGGELQVEGTQVRVRGQGGLLIDPEAGRWYCFRDELGGDAIDLTGYALYGAAWRRSDKQIFRAALQQAAEFAGVDLHSRRNGHHHEQSPRASGHRARQGSIDQRGPGASEPSPAPPAEDSPPIHQTDLGNARRLLRRYGDRLRYVPTWGAWLIWDGTRWVVDETGEVDRLARSTVASIYEEAAQATDADERKALARWALSSESRTRLENMIALARQEPGVPVRHDQLDADPFLLNCGNGTIDLRTGELHPHRPEQLLTKRTDVEYHPAAPCPTWQHFLQRVLDGNQELIAFLQRAVGYTLTGDLREQCLFFMYGTGRNGKSTFTETLLALLGDYQQKAPTEMLMAKGGQGGIPNDVARLQGARLVVTAEIEEGRRLAESLVKDLTGGDTIVARFLRQEYFQFTPTHKIWMYGNHKPLVRGTDEGIWRRLHLIPFTVRIPDHEQDRDLPAKLQAELPGILAWAVQGAVRWQQERLQVPAAVTQATAAYRSEMDVVGAFIADRCVTGSGCEAMASQLYSAYTAWCEDTGETPLNQRRFGMQLSERGFERRRSTGNRWRWSGIGLRDHERSDPPPPPPTSDPRDPSDPSPPMRLKHPTHGGDTDQRVTWVTQVTSPAQTQPEARTATPTPATTTPPAAPTQAHPSNAATPAGEVYEDARLEREIRQLLECGRLPEARQLVRRLRGNVRKRALEQLVREAAERTRHDASGGAEPADERKEQDG